MSEAGTVKDLDALRRHVQELLDAQCRELDFTLRVTDLHRQVEDWVYLVVTPDREGVRAYDYAKVLSDVELVLHRDENVEHVLLVPALDD